LRHDRRWNQLNDAPLLAVVHRPRRPPQERQGFVPSRSTTTGIRALGLALALAAGLSGCSLPDVSMSPGLAGEAASSATPSTAEATTAEPTTVAAVAPARTPGDLDTGSVTHSVTAGDRTVVIDWWTDQDATSWTPDADKTVQLSAHIEGGTDDQAVEVTRFVAVADDGATRTTVTEDRGEFVLTPPFSYSTALSPAPSADTADQLTLAAQFDLLVETEPGSQEWFRQTVLDSIQLPLLQEDSQ
jgi:hypothetical protein